MGVLQRLTGRLDTRRLRNTTACLAVLAAICCAQIWADESSSGTSAWKYCGPDGADIHDIAISPSDPSTLYVNASGGSVFRTTNGAARWERVFKRPQKWYWHIQPAVDPLTPTTVYQVFSGVPGYRGWVLARTTNGGANWKMLTGGDLLPSAQVYCLAIDWARPSTLYVGTRYQRVLKSTDGGLTWHKSGSGITEQEVIELVVSPADPAMVYAVSSDWHLFKTTNGGASWELASAGMAEETEVASLRVCASDPDVLYAVGGDFYVVKSYDGGRTWRRTRKPSEVEYMYPCAVDPTTPDIVYASCTVPYGGATLLMTTTDGGRTWARVTGIPNTGLRRLLIDPSTPTTLYLGTQKGVFKSTDRGATWNMAVTGMHESVIYDISVDPFDANTVYSTTPIGLVKTTNGGATWSILDDYTKGEWPFIWYPVVDPKTPNTVYAKRTDGDFLKSVDGGIHWTVVGHTWRVSWWVIDPKTPTTMYGSGDVVSEAYKTTDGGVTWKKCTRFSVPYQEGWIQEIAIDPINPSTVYAAYTEDYTLSRSMDATATRDNLAIGDYMEHFRPWKVLDCDERGRRLAEGIRSPHQPSGRFNTTLWKSTDAGATWDPLPVGHWYENWAVWTIAFDTTAPGTLYVIQYGPKGVWKSVDGGATWTQTAPVGGGHLSSVFAPPNAAGVLYASARLFADWTHPQDGVYKTTDGGATWISMNQGLGNKKVWSVVSSPASPSRLYAITDGGIYRYDQSP